MKTSERIRRGYERHPYPHVPRAREAARPLWQLPPLSWIEAMWRPHHEQPRRILIAGCGTGNEAFAFHERFPDAEIIGVDFSARSIALARARAKNAAARPIVEFHHLDLTSKSFPRRIAGSFDFISCHGVLSYIPDADRALANLSACLAPDGALYLGVNGAAHYSERWRPALKSFGVDCEEYAESRRSREVLELFDALASHKPGHIAGKRADYLAGDLFGALINNRPLEDWLSLAVRHGLHFRGSYAGHITLRRAFNADLFARLCPLSRADAHRLAEQIAPSSFNALVLSATADPNSRWEDRRHLRGEVFSPTRIYRHRRSRDGALRLTSAATNTAVTLHVPRWVETMLAGADGQRELQELIGPAAKRITPRSLREHTYLLYLLAAINVAPPVST